jgi:ABC-type transport system substrate-binding protein
MDYIKKHIYFFIRTFFIGCYFFLSTYKISAQEISIYGWPDTTMPLGTPYLGFGDEPIIGRLTCPPLTRYNHSTQKSEALIVVPVMHSELLWEYKLRQGIYWWDGSIFTASNLLSFLKKNMGRILSEKGLDHEKKPRL